MGNFLTQPANNETRVGLMNFFGGLMAFSMVTKVVTKGTAQYPRLILDRYLRHAPAMAALLAHEFLWPLIFSGTVLPRFSECVLCFTIYSNGN